MLTWYSAMFPSRMSTRCSLIQALRTFRSVLVARATPLWMASSKLFVDVELISVTRATAMVSVPPGALVPTGGGCNRSSGRSVPEPVDPKAAAGGVYRRSPRKVVGDHDVRCGHDSRGDDQGI